MHKILHLYYFKPTVIVCLKSFFLIGFKTMTESITNAAQTSNTPSISTNNSVTASPTAQTENGENNQDSQNISTLDSPAVVIQQTFDERTSIVREFERSQERRLERDDGSTTPIDRIRQRETALERQSEVSEEQRGRILLAAQQASAQLSLQLTTTLSNGLANALEFYQGFNERRNG